MPTPKIAAILPRDAANARPREAVGQHPADIERPSPAPLVLAAGVFLAFFAMNLQVLSDWSTYSFDDGTYSHAYLIPFMAAFVLFSAWKRRQLRVERSLPMLLAMVAVLLAYQWLEMAHQRYLARVLVPACLALALFSIFRPNRYIAGAAALLWFITPVWGPVNAFLQWASVEAVAAIMSFTSIPTDVYGEYVQIPAGTFEIADGCSGLRYVIATLALVTFYGVLYLRSLTVIAAFTLIALLGAMLTNWLRITALILIGHYTNMQSSLIDDHNMFGWFLFFPLMLVIFRLADGLESRSTSATGEPPSSAPQHGGAPYLLAAPTLLCLLLFSGVTLRGVTGQPVFALPEQLDVDSATALHLPHEPAPRVFAAENVRAELLTGFADGTAYRITFDGAIDAQRAEFYLNDPAPVGWSVEETRQLATEAELRLRREGQEALVRYAWGVDGRWTADKRSLRMLRLAAALRLDRRSELAWVFVRCGARCGTEDGQDAQKAISRVTGPRADAF